MSAIPEKRVLIFMGMITFLCTSGHVVQEAQLRTSRGLDHLGRTYYYVYLGKVVPLYTRFKLFILFGFLPALKVIIWWDYLISIFYYEYVVYLFLFFTWFQAGKKNDRRINCVLKRKFAKSPKKNCASFQKFENQDIIYTKQLSTSAWIFLNIF